MFLEQQPGVHHKTKKPEASTYSGVNTKINSFADDTYRYLLVDCDQKFFFPCGDIKQSYVNLV